MAPYRTVPPYVFTAAYLALSPANINQMPQLRRFSGDESGDGDLLQDWLDQFESVALLGGWGEHGKLVNLTTRLRGTAYAFYRLCSPEQRSSYPLRNVVQSDGRQSNLGPTITSRLEVGGVPTDALVDTALKKRFTPVKLTAIHTQMFHGRVQKEKESVEFAQTLRKLFNKTYSTVVCGEPEANSMGQTVLAIQFISGLRPELVGTDGNLDQLLVKTQFKEAKKKELAAGKITPPPKKPVNTPHQSAPARNTQIPRTSPANPGTQKPYPKARICFNCGMHGHLQRLSPYPRQQKSDHEVHGRNMVSHQLPMLKRKPCHSLQVP